MFVRDLLISVSPKHPTGSKAKITFLYFSSNISSSNPLQLSLQISICSLQEMKESQQLDSLPSLGDIFKIYDHTVTVTVTETERFVGNAKIRIINVSSVLQIAF